MTVTTFPKLRSAGVQGAKAVGRAQITQTSKARPENVSKKPTAPHRGNEGHNQNDHESSLPRK
jgi:hypothetical protein